MATSLQQQLAAIARNSTQQLDLKAQQARHGASLLFDAREAAAQSFDSIYQLCVEGFDDLCRLDGRFLPFARTLFSPQSRSEDRGSMAAAEVAALDAAIERFLALLAGRLLLQPGLKAAEWLVRRFHVHRHNTEALLLAFLPCHAAPVFANLLAILPAQLPPTCRFLHPYVAPPVQNPPRHAVVAAAATPAFFAAFSRHVLRVAAAGHHSAHLLGFWASVTAQAVNGMLDAARSGRESIRRQNEEDVLLRVLPVLQSALAVRDVPELYLASCMIMTIIATKATLSEKVLDAMVEAVAGGWTEKTVDDGMVVLAVLAEEKQRLSLPRAASRRLLEHDGLLTVVDRIGDKYRVQGLLAGIGVGAVESLARNDAPQAKAILLQLLASATLSEPRKVLVLEAALRTIADAPSTDAGQGCRQALVDAVRDSAREPDAARLLQEASRKADVSLGQLDVGLALQIQQSGSNDEEDSDPEPMLIDNDVGASAHEGRLTLDHLDQLPSSDASFLDPANKKAFDEYSAVFQKASSSKKDLSAFLAIPTLQKQAAAKQPALLSFLLHIGSSEASVSAKAKALTITRDVFEQLRQEGQAIDMQALIPYLVAALADSAKAVRSAAAAASASLVKLGRHAAKSTASGNTEIWGKNSIYGKSSAKVHWLSQADTHKFLSDGLSPILEDCIVDQSYVVQALADAINAPSTAVQAHRKELKQALRASLFSNLATHVVSTPSAQVKTRLLNILSKIGTIAGSSRTQILLPYAKHVLASSSGATECSSADDLSKALIANVTARSSDEIQFLKSLAVGRTNSSSTMSTLGFTRLRQIWSRMKEAAQRDLADWLLTSSFDTDASEETQSNATETLRSLAMPTSILVHLVGSLPGASDLHDQPPSAKKRRTSEFAKPGSVDKKKLGGAISKITSVLEIVEGSKPEKHPELLNGLFYLLGELHHYKSLLESELVYLQGLLINNLLFVVNGLKSTPNPKVDKSVIRPDLIVECVRTTSSTQVHQAALLLMSALASWAPDLVLHSVMPLFTFMSATILKQGDDYSAHVTDQTVSQIIPPLAASLKKRGRDLISGAAELLLSFTAAFEHIPLHRRDSLFQHLVQTLGANESLFAIMAMLLERYPEDPSVLPFISTLMDKFSGSTQLLAVRHVLDLIFDTLKKGKRGLSDVILGYGEKNGEEATASTKVLMEGLASTLATSALRKKLAKELKHGGEDSASLRNAYSVILEKAMQLDLQLKDHNDLEDSATNLLASLLGLLPTNDFIEASGTLMQAGSDDIRRQVFWSLEQRVKAAKRGDTALQKTLIELLPQCALFVAPDRPSPTRLAAIKCIDCIAERFGKTDRAAVSQAAEKIAGEDALGVEKDDDLKMTSILCLASMVEVLADQFIPILPKTLETIASYMDTAYEMDKPDVKILNAGFSFGSAVLDYIPWMLSGQHLNRLLVLAAACGHSQALSFSGLAAKKTSADSFLTAIKDTWEHVAKLTRDESGQAAFNHVQALRQAVQHHTKSTISKNAQTLFDILLQAHDLRRVLIEDDAETDVSALSALVNTTTMDAVLKLNDATFGPFFIRLGEWANSPKGQAARTLRQISFFGFGLVLFDQLKSLVTSYASYLLEDAAALLQSLEPASAHERELLQLILLALTSNISNDQDGFWQSPAHLDAIAEPLISRLQLAGTLDVTQHVIPAIVELAAAMQSPDHHKSINGKVMVYMRDEDADVRLAAVKCERALTDRLHIDWLHLLPEMLPFISELQEDDEGTVERETLRWIHQIEEVTGESLDSMLQ